MTLCAMPNGPDKDCPGRWPSVWRIARQLMMISGLMTVLGRKVDSHGI